LHFHYALLTVCLLFNFVTSCCWTGVDSSGPVLSVQL
jgi:hypothetical protein